MSQVGLTMTEGAPAGGPPGHKRSRAAVWIALVVVFALLAVAAWFVYSSFLKPAPDYEGDGTGTVIIKVESGQSIPAIGNTLASKDVVKSADAFVDAASDDPKARTIQAGVYKMKSQMSAQAALNVLTNPSNKAGVVIVTEGMRANKVAQVAADATGVPLAEFEKVIANPSNIGLPTWGNNHIEGFLYPATYDFEPGTSATAVFKTMVAKFKEYAASINLERQAAASGQSPYDVLKIASILEAESQPADYAKVARVIDNRIACTLPACKAEYIQGRLQMDSTINYAQNTSDINLSKAELSADGPYNTYKNKGLPPTPIGNPGAAAIEAALNPAPGNWLYFVSDQGFTEFSDTFAQQKAAEERYRASKGQ